MRRSQRTDLVPRGIGNLMEAFFELIYNLTEVRRRQGGRQSSSLVRDHHVLRAVCQLAEADPGFESIGVIHHIEHAEGTAFRLCGAIGSISSRWKGEYMLVPFLRGISVDLNFTVALALISVVMIQVVGFRAQGIGYLSKSSNFTSHSRSRSSRPWTSWWVCWR